MQYQWPKKTIQWIENRTIFVSIPFTWLLKETFEYLQKPNSFWDNAIVGGPAIFLIPDYFKNLSHVKEEYHFSGVLQRVNPNATRTTLGCVRSCGFCGVSKIEPVFKELINWPDLPILCDNNILASSQNHFDKVCDRLEKHGWCDFNQGIDARLLNEYHVERFKRIGKPIIRLAFDNKSMCNKWESAFDILMRFGIAKKRIRSYCLIGFNDTPQIAWENCIWVEKHGIKPLPMWYHKLTAMEFNSITEDQIKCGWTDYERRKIMQWFYKHKEAKNPSP